MTEYLISMFAGLVCLALVIAFSARNTTIWRVRVAFIDDDKLFTDAYNALPSYYAMIYNPRYWSLSTKQQWVGFVRTKLGTVK